MTSTPISGPEQRFLTQGRPIHSRGDDDPTLTGVAVITSIVTTLALLWAYYVTSPWKQTPQDWGIDSDQGFVGLLWIAGFVALGVGVVYGVVVRRALAGDPARAARTALILALVAVPLGVVAFWTGLPIVLGSAAVFLGLDARTRLGRTPATAAIAHRRRPAHRCRRPLLLRDGMITMRSLTALATAAAVPGRAPRCRGRPVHGIRRTAP